MGRPAGDVDALAARLLDAAASRTPIPPLTDDVELTVTRAYDVQDAVVAQLDVGPAPIAKLGLTSRAKQEQMAVDAPLSGWFGHDMALEPGEPVATGELIQPRVEPEIALLTSATLSGPGVTAAHVLAATAAVLPAVDVLDSRFAGYRFTLPDVVADNASAARCALGDPVPVDGIDLALAGCVFSCNGVLVATAAGAAVLDHPAAAVAWLVRDLARRGRELPAGSIVLSGALTAAIAVAAGDVVRVTIDRIGALELACR
ncbi:MAG: fumarylacetoacetate hydrolase family protein [Actinobacteria bacterium]|nr:fumarylacetoacetate hydrolase family protein [Actinomycetota bacterium]